MSAYRWAIRWGDRRWTDGDLAGIHLVLMAVGNGADSWDLSPTAGPQRLISALAALISVDEGRDFADVVSELLVQPASRLLEAVEVVDGDDDVEEDSQWLE